ncbi:MAG: DUF368 domain-containing protein [Candidatus Omnitrophica bacterium]|nr:DUF368 domain-containing protein [Candidatus Omnitrophota bacterium]
MQKKEAGPGLALFVKGLFIGLGNLTSGIPLATIIFSLSFYEDFITFLKKTSSFSNITLLLNKDKEKANKANKPKLFFSFTAGLLIGALALPKLFGALMLSKPVYFNALYFGFVSASLIMISRNIKPWTKSNLLILISTSAVTFLLFRIEPFTIPNHIPLLVIMGLAASLSALLPGLSGTFILAFLGQYYYLMDIFHNRSIALIALFIAGILLGIYSFSRLISAFVSKRPVKSRIIFMGMVIGSIYKIWPWHYPTNAVILEGGRPIPLQVRCFIPTNYQADTIITAALLVFGFISAILFHLYLSNARPGHEEN